MAKDKARSGKKEKEAEEQAVPAKNPLQQAKILDEEAQTARQLAALNGTQRAAAVVVSLGVEKASEIYKFMEPEEVESLTLEVARLGYLNSQVTEKLLGDFYQECLTHKAVTEGGLEYARTVLEKAFGEQTANNLLDRIEKSLKNRQFAFMDRADAKSLYSALQYERPQAISLILSFVSPDKAANVIEQLSQDLQVKVVENMARMESASPVAMEIIEDELSRKFSTIINDKNEKVGGIDYVASIMNNLDRSNEKRIFDGLSAYNSELVDEIRKRMFVFEDIATMDDRSVQRFLRDCDAKDIVLSLKSATIEVSRKLLSNMSTRMAENIQDDLEVTTNVRMRDVENAQQRVVDTIRRLEEQNEIIILKGGKDDVIV